MSTQQVVKSLDSKEAPNTCDYETVIVSFSK